MHSAFLRQGVSCPIFIWGPLKSQPAAEAVPGKLISVTLVYFPLLFEFFPMEWGSQRQLVNGWVMAHCHSGGHWFPEGSGCFCLCCPEHSWPQSQLMGGETEALGIPTGEPGEGRGPVGSKV